MGALNACQDPEVEDAAPDSSKKKKELALAEAEQLIEIPGAEVVVMDNLGHEEAVAQGGFRFVKLPPPSQLAVLFVGESLEAAASAESFYYPLLPKTPLVMAGRAGGHVLTMTAGDEDIFALSFKLSKDDEKLQCLKELLEQHCLFHLVEEPDYADSMAGHIIQGGRKLSSGVSTAADFMSAGIAKGGDLLRHAIGKSEQEVQVGMATKASVASAKVLSKSTVAVATAVTDALMDTALMLGQEVSKVSKGEGSPEPPVKDGKMTKLGKAAGVAGLEVFASLFSAGDRILDETVDQTANTVGHRYGKDAGGVALDGLKAARNITKVKDMVGKKAITRLAAKGAMYTAQGMIQGSPSKGSSTGSLVR